MLTTGQLIIRKISPSTKNSNKPSERGSRHYKDAYLRKNNAHHRKVKQGRQLTLLPGKTQLRSQRGPKSGKWDSVPKGHLNREDRCGRAQSANSAIEKQQYESKMCGTNGQIDGPTVASIREEPIPMSKANSTQRGEQLANTHIYKRRKTEHLTHIAEVITSGKLRSRAVSSRLPRKTHSTLVKPQGVVECGSNHTLAKRPVFLKQLPLSENEDRTRNLPGKQKSTQPRRRVQG